MALRVPPKTWKWLGAALLGAVFLGLAVRQWVVPMLIVRQVEAALGGKAEIRGWWLNQRSAGVLGLTLREGGGADAPVWATAQRVTADLTLGGLLAGRTSPRRLTLERPAATLRFDRAGALLTRVGGHSAGGAAALPVVVAQQARLTVAQEGRPPLTVSGVTARLAPDGEAVQASVSARDPEWGPLQASGRFDGSFRAGTVVMKTPRGIAIDPEKARRLPFVPPQVWDNVVPRGLVDVRIEVEVGAKGTTAPRVRAEVVLRDTSAQSPALGLTASRATGRVVVQGGVVRLEKVAGRALGGTIEANGSLDLDRPPPRCDVRLRLQGIDVASAPKSWQLEEAGVTGRLSGDVRLLARLDPQGVDLTGSSGDAVVEGGTIQGIPVKSLKLDMKAVGSDLQFETGQPESATTSARPPAPGWLAAGLVGLLAPGAEPAPKGAAPARPRIKLPGSITTRIELEDVDIVTLVKRAEYLLGYPFPVPITGRMSVKADATIPLGRLRDVGAYAFHGTLSLKGASIYRVDFGHLTSRIDLAGGVLQLKDFRGRLADHPNGGPDNPPAPEPAVPAEGPLPAGAFRADLRAAISPLGAFSSRFEGASLPLGELAAPVLPRPTPVAGLVSLNAEAKADLAKATDPGAWSVSGRADSRRITYRGGELDGVSFSFSLTRGRLDVPDLAARLAGRPLGAKLGLDLAPPRAFDAALDVTGWDLASLLALVPSAPRPAPASGTITANATASGTITPLKLRTTQGRGRLDRFQAGPVPLGDIPFRWTSEEDSILLSVLDARPFGGRLRASVRVPDAPGRPIRGAATLADIDTAQVAAAAQAPGLQLSGRAGGRIDFTVPADASSLQADVHLDAPDLTVQGLPAEHVRASVGAKDRAIHYEITADSLGGKVKFTGDIPLAAAPGPAKSALDGEIRVVGFSLADALRTRKAPAALAGFDGLGAVDANVRVIRAGPGAGLWAHGVAEFRDLRLGTALPLGALRAVVALTPATFRVEPLSGNLLGGLATGSVTGRMAPAAGVPRLSFEMAVERLNLRRALAARPAAAGLLDAVATIRVAGNLTEALRANADLEVPQGRVAGLPLTELRAPVELVYTPATGTGILHLRRFSARVAGGQVRGDGTLDVGAERAFHADLSLSGLDLQTLLRAETDARQPATGRISGRITLSGTDPALTRSYRGKVNLDLDDASLVSLPVFRELDQFLGAAQGGLFEDGDLAATIANRQLLVDALTLEGRLAQLHASGTVGFDGQLDLEVLINTNQIISQTGQALVAAVPGLGGLAGRRQEAAARFSSYLSNRLLKLHVTGTVRNPTLNADPGILVAESAVGFFGAVLKLPLAFLP